MKCLVKTNFPKHLIKAKLYFKVFKQGQQGPQKLSSQNNLKSPPPLKNFSYQPTAVFKPQPSYIQATAVFKPQLYSSHSCIQATAVFNPQLYSSHSCIQATAVYKPQLYSSHSCIQATAVFNS